ncbi:MAG TPA: glycine C-acetyltransferase, partial [Vicinamibacteria bacterium]
MPDNRFTEFLAGELKQIREQGLWKEEWPILGPQGPEIRVQGREGSVLNFCANNYLGLSGHPDLLASAHRTLDEWGYGLSSVRFICGTQALHLELEKKVAAFLGMDEAILYVACFDANGGVFEPLLGEADAILTDRLNHASIIDGVRLCKAKRYLYEHADMKDLDAKLKEAAGARFRLVVTDGVFSMDGDVAPLKEICDLADRHRALVLVDDSHATGFMGKTGRGTPEHCGVAGRVDILTTTFGKALGGASGGCIAARKEIVDLLRQRSRPYLFSNTLAPVVVGATLRALDLLSRSTELRDRLEGNTRAFRQRMAEAGFEIRPGVHPIVPIMFSRFAPDDAPLAQRFARALLDEGVYVKG